MSVSKLESLPNEILVDLLEKYINAVDVFVAFFNQLNSRFNALIDQCQQFHFDFTSIRKKDFQICVNRLPNYFDKIKGLTLSECDTPGQINIFLSLFPPLNKFNELREFHLDFDVITVDKYQINEVLHSLSNSNLCTLSIKGTHISVSSILNSINTTILALPTLKRLILDTNFYTALRDFDKSTFFNIEHLIIAGHGCTWNELQHISRCSPRLKYLNVRVTNKFSNTFSSTVDIPPLTKLYTVILHFIDRYTEITWNQLVDYFRIMPNLHHLEVINSHNRFFNANDWQILFEISLSLLKRFTLKISAARLSQHGLDSIHTTLISFQTPFWIEKKNFNIFIMMCKSFGNIIYYYQPIDPQQHRFDIDFKSEIQSGTIQFWTVPERSISDNCFLLDKITSLRLSAKDPLPPSQYYFENVKYLKVDHINLSLFKWITTHIHLSKIKKLIILETETKCRLVTSLIALIENISSLQINFNQLIHQQYDLIKTKNNIKRLNISFGLFSNQQIFRKKDICIIADLFPLIEHLIIDTIDFENVPFLYICLPHLHSLTFKLIDLTFPRFDSFKERQWDNRLRDMTRLTFKRTEEWLTIWIDEVAFQESNWSSFQLKSQSNKCCTS
ncbi:unnamed protein product [Rotaria sordida]|uniref:F-box domain-containing protein n=1 Tax=Rotaria sordida TaxID=392033 RepID=A0A814MGF8_9BILA|nr:unnamed protein product [Rotaria sordida]